MPSVLRRRAVVVILAAGIACLGAPASAQLVNPVTNQLWSFGTSSIVRTDLATLAQQSVPISASPSLLRIDPIRNRVYVRHATGALTMVDGRTLVVTPLIAGSTSGPTDLALDPERNRIWAIVPGGVQVIDGGDFSSDTIVPPTAPFKLAVDPVADRAYVGAIAWPPASENPLAILRQLAPDPAAVVDSIELTMNSSFLPHWGVAVDPSTGRTYSQLWSGMYGGPSLNARADWSTHDVLVQAGGGVGLVIDPPGGRLWAILPGDGGFGGCDSTRAFSLTTLSPLAGTSQVVCNIGLTVNPATTRAYVSGYTNGNGEELVLHILDPVTPAIDSTLFGLFSYGGLLGLNVATNRVYVSVNGSIIEIDEPIAAPLPIEVTITPGTPSPSGSVSVSFGATTDFPLPIRRIYYQVDAIDGEWTAATPAGASGNATLADLSAGSHVIHAFATDGQEATIASGPGQAVVVGPIASVEISVPAPTACSNGVDDDGDSLADYPDDPGCRTAINTLENPHCDNGVDDDGDLAIDHPSDAKCRGRWDNDEATDPGGTCGLGAELLLVLTAMSSRRMRAGAMRD